jgi:CxxC-x17-CxxC domain-containing protein
MSKFDDKRQRSRNFDDRRSERPRMHKATCSDCGSSCEVPFRPTGNKPVLCSDCFQGGANTGFNRNAGRKSFSKPRFKERQMFDAICDKCKKSCVVPFRPTGDKPIYCDACFTKGDSANSNINDQLNKQIELINSKLDRILKALARTAPNITDEQSDLEKTDAKSSVIIVSKKKKIAKDESKPVEKKAKKTKTVRKSVKKAKK